MNQEREEAPAILTDSDIDELPVQAEAGDNPASAATRSLVDDIEDLVGDARTYFDAEFSYQKSRAGFVADSLKRVILSAIIAIVVAFFAFGALTVGLIIALTPLVTAWGATAIVVGAMLLVIALLLFRAARGWSDMMGAIKDSDAAKSDANLEESAD